MLMPAAALKGYACPNYEMSLCFFVIVGGGIESSGSSNQWSRMVSPSQYSSEGGEWAHDDEVESYSWGKVFQVTGRRA